MDQARTGPEWSDALVGLIRAQETAVDKDARQAVADRARDKRRGNCRVDPAGERADRMAVTDACPYLGDRLLDERGRRPVAGRAAHAIEEVAQDLRAVRRVPDLGM